MANKKLVSRMLLAVALSVGAAIGLVLWLKLTGVLLGLACIAAGLIIGFATAPRWDEE